MLRTLLRLGLAAGLAVPVCAQGQVWVVDDDGGPLVLSDLQSAVDAAGDGDAILVRPGIYDGTTEVVGKSLVIVAESGAVFFDTVPTQGAPSRLRIRDLGPGQNVTLLGGKFEPWINSSGGSGVEVSSSAGSVWIERTQGCGRFGLRVTDSPAVVGTRASLVGVASFLSPFAGPSGDAMKAEGAARVALYDSDLEGTVGTPIDCNEGCCCQTPSQHGESGLVLADTATMYASGTSFRGGFGGNGGSSSGCSPFGGGSGGDGGAGVELEALTLLNAVDCIIEAGAGGGGACLGDDGVPVTGTGTLQTSSGLVRSPVSPDTRLGPDAPLM